MGIYFSPAVGVRLKSWSFSDGKILDGPSWKDERPTYYIFHSHGISPTPWQFWIEFQVSIFKSLFTEYIYNIQIISIVTKFSLNINHITFSGTTKLHKRASRIDGPCHIWAHYTWKWNEIARI